MIMIARSGTMNIWLHRISHHAEFSYPLLQQGYLSIGYSDFADKEFPKRHSIRTVKLLTNGFLLNGAARLRKDSVFGVSSQRCERATGSSFQVPGLSQSMNFLEDRPMLLVELDLSKLRDWDDPSVYLASDGYVYIKESDASEKRRAALTLASLEKSKPLRLTYPDTSTLTVLCLQE